MPAVAEGVELPWDKAIDDVVAVVSEARAKVGDTFVVDSGIDRYLFTFSPIGVRNFYALPEDRASKGVADWRMLRPKVPDELFSGRRTFPHDLFGRADAHHYLANVHAAFGVGGDRARDFRDRRDLRVNSTPRSSSRVGFVGWSGIGGLAEPRAPDSRLRRARRVRVVCRPSIPFVQVGSLPSTYPSSQEWALFDSPAVSPTAKGHRRHHGHSGTSSPPSETFDSYTS